MGRGQAPKCVQARGIDFIDAHILFDGRPVLTDLAHRTGEERWLSIGQIEGRMMTVVWTWREDRVRIFTMRRARDEEKTDTVRYTEAELAAMRQAGKSRTNWQKVDAMSEAELAASIAADPDDVHEHLDWTQAVKGIPERKQAIKLRIDANILSWFKAKGKGYQTRMNNVLRAYVDSREKAEHGPLAKPRP